MTGTVLAPLTPSIPQESVSARRGGSRRTEAAASASRTPRRHNSSPTLEHVGGQTIELGYDCLAKRRESRNTDKHHEAEQERVFNQTLTMNGGIFWPRPHAPDRGIKKVFHGFAGLVRATLTKSR